MTELEAAAAIVRDNLASATMTGYLVGFYKKGFPLAKDRSIIAAAILSGFFSVLMVSMTSGGIHLSQQYLGTLVLQGITAAGLAAAVQVVNKPPPETMK